MNSQTSVLILGDPRQYAEEASMLFLSFSSVTSLKGPVPLGPALRAAVPDLMSATDRIGRVDSSFKRGAKGVLVFRRAVYLSTTSTVVGTNRPAVLIFSVSALAPV